MYVSFENFGFADAADLRVSFVGFTAVFTAISLTVKFTIDKYRKLNVLAL
jgi:hypothetical protein